MKADEKALRDEERKLRRLRLLVDVTAAVIAQSDLSLARAQELVAFCRAQALELFPDKAETFDLIYGSRFRRILTEKYRLP